MRLVYHRAEFVALASEGARRVRLRLAAKGLSITDRCVADSREWALVILRRAEALSGATWTHCSSASRSGATRATCARGGATSERWAQNQPSSFAVLTLTRWNMRSGNWAQWVKLLPAQHDRECVGLRVDACFVSAMAALNVRERGNGSQLPQNSRRLRALAPGLHTEVASAVT